jgi:hypothetical protein
LASCVLAISLIITPDVAADDSKEAWVALAKGGHVALIRHGNAPPGYGGDPPGFRIDDCKTQRNLDELGREQARALGEAFRSRGVRVDRIVSSPVCRCLETADLMAVGTVEKSWALLPDTVPSVPVRLSQHCSAAAVDGVDITPEMLDVARSRGVYRTLGIADVLETGLPAETYDLCTQSLADEHLPDLGPLYREVGRVTKRGGHFVIVGFHPQFLMAGVPTHFDRAPGEPVTIRSYVHLLSDHVKAAHAAGWSLLEMDEGLVDDAWLQRKPKWQNYLGLPISFSMVWRHR